MVPHNLVGAHEIAEMLGVSRQRVNKIAATDKSFPKPEAVLTAGRIWQIRDVEAWIEQRRRRQRRREDEAAGE